MIRFMFLLVPIIKSDFNQALINATEFKHFNCEIHSNDIDLKLFHHLTTRFTDKKAESIVCAFDG